MKFEKQPIDYSDSDRFIALCKGMPMPTKSSIAAPSVQGIISISTLPTIPVNENSFPNELATATRDQVMPWIRITHTSTLCNCIHTYKNLGLFTQVAHQVIQMIHDLLGAERVHLISVSPASTILTFEQLLQAGHHPSYQLYERPDGAHNYLPALTLTVSRSSQIPPTAQNRAKFL